MQRGFSLVELSIVLVILGLLTGGILAGQSLIRAAEMRSVSVEVNRYVTAAQTFRDKYFALPGDMANATKFWTAEPVGNCPGDETTPSTTAATCNGNGDGRINWQLVTAGIGGESHRFWQHLANAGLIEGSYSGTHSAGTCNTNGSCNVTLGTNAPRSKLSNAGWTVTYFGDVSGGYLFDGSYGNAYAFGRVENYTTGPALKPEEAWNIDTKMDDGKPGIGNISTWRSDSAHPNCADSTTATANYRLSVNSLECPLVIKSNF